MLVAPVPVTAYRLPRNGYRVPICAGGMFYVESINLNKSFTAIRNSLEV
jgi:hypothetical protein